MATSRESSRTTSEPAGSYEFSASRPCLKKGHARKVHTNPGGSDAVRESSREPAMFQIGL